MGAGATVEALARTTRTVIAGLTGLDPGERRDVPADDRGWRFTFAGERFFVVTFGPCYGPESSRYAFGLEATYLLFQTRSSFVRRWGPGNRPAAGSRARGDPARLRVGGPPVRPREHAVVT
jgi:hypothetical protein